jgi:molecular chaperone HtpG
MRPGQDKIYYITADTFKTAQSSPHLEVFRKKQIEVLLLHDRVDEWMVSHLGEYEKHALQSVAKGDIDLEGVGVAEQPADKKKEEAREAELAPLLARVREVLGEQVKEVRFSHRLTTSPACLVVDQNDMGIQLQRLLKAAGQQAPEVRPILELNPDHQLVAHLQAESDPDRFSEWASVLFDQAMLVEGGQLADPAGFVQKVNKLLGGLAAS